MLTSIWVTLRKPLGILAAIILGGAALLGALVIFILVGVSMNDPRKQEVIEPEWQRTKEVYLRNRTATPLLVMLTLPRTAVVTDTVWWGVAIDPSAIGRAVVATHLEVNGLRYPSEEGLALLARTDDTLVAAHYDKRVTGPVGRRNFFYPLANLARWAARMQGTKPRFDQSVCVQRVPEQADSLRLVIRVAPDSAFLAAHCEEYAYSGDDDTPAQQCSGVMSAKARNRTLRLTVQWQDKRQRRQQRPVSLAGLQESAEKNRQTQARNTKQVHYIDYR